MNMKKEALEYADKLLGNLPENAFEDRIFEREKPSEENPNPTWPAWQPELLLKLVGDGLLSKRLRKDEYDSQEKYAYSITPEGAELINKGVLYKDFILQKEIGKQKEKDRREKEDVIQNLTIRQLRWTIWQVKYWWVFLIINFGIAIITAILTIMIENK